MKPCYCINPNCSQPDHPDNNNPHNIYCQSCHSDLLLNGKYRVSRLLSDNSGFGIVYEAFQGFSAKILKVLQSQWNCDPKVIQLFQREYEALYNLTRQNVKGVPQVEDYFAYQTKQGETLYCLVMEKVEGIDLEHWVNQYEKLNQRQALKWLREITLILDKIHQIRWFHRDIKPANIMLRNSGELVLIDFGTAREETQTYYQKVQGQNLTGITSEGYTPNEQRHGQSVLQSDFFALGRTFVHLLTGKRPYDLYDALNDQLNWREQTENIHPLLLDLIDDLMQRLPRDRPANAQVILQRLDQIEQQLNSSSSVKKSNLPDYYPQQSAQTIRLNQSSQRNKPQPNKPQKTILSRRSFLKWLGWGSTGVVAFFILSSIVANLDSLFQVADNDKPRDDENKPPDNSNQTLDDDNEVKPEEDNNQPQNLPTFRFETVMVNNRGEITNRETKTAKYFTEDLGNGIKLDLVYIPGGTFMMGTEDAEIERLVQKFDREWFRNESPQHKVTIKPFYMSKYPITQAQWKAIAKRTDLKVKEDLELEPSYFKDNPKSFSFPSARGNLDLPEYGNNPTRWHRPIERVNWYQAQEFCARLSKLKDKAYGLPSEAKWEYACRAIQNEESSQNLSYPPFHFGETITSDLVNYRGTNIYADEQKGVYRGETTPVGMFVPNGFGLYDMHGNVWEWCEDDWHENYKNAPNDGTAWKSKDSEYIMLRGGSYDNDPSGCRSASRYFNSRVDSYDFIGLRVVCVLPRTVRN